MSSKKIFVWFIITCFILMFAFAFIDTELAQVTVHYTVGGIIMYALLIIFGKHHE